MCEGCKGPTQGKKFHEVGSAGVQHHGNSWGAAHEHCTSAETRQAGHVILSAMCRDADIPINQAEDACKHLVANEEFFKDCQIDYCASGGSLEAAEGAKEEETLENPQPLCMSGDECDPAADCCAALKDQAILTLDDVTANEICSGGELRYGSALTQNGQTMDLVVKLSVISRALESWTSPSSAARTLKLASWASSQELRRLLNSLSWPRGPTPLLCRSP